MIIKTGLITKKNTVVPFAAELINDKILLIKGILAEKCGLNPDLYDELSELLDDVKILSDAKSSALENAYTELRQLTLPVVSKRSSCCNASIDTDEQSCEICSNCGERL